jgi:hypothetical protein
MPRPSPAASYLIVTGSIPRKSQQALRESGSAASTCPRVQKHEFSAATLNLLGSNTTAASWLPISVSSARSATRRTHSTGSGP